ncbi:MAG: LAGLIDADG family homing endonuclease [Candidatus Diapherotrites archaeon]
MKRWNTDEIKSLEKLWPNNSKKELAKRFSGRSYRALLMKALKLGLKRHYKKPLKKGFDKSRVGLAQFLGNITGDGHIGKTSISYTNSSLTAVRQFKKNLKKQFGIARASELHYPTFYRTNASSVLLGEWLHRAFEGNILSRNKIVPEIVRAASDRFKGNYLAYLFGDDGGFIVDRGTPRLTLTSKSRRLAYGVKKMLKEDFGIDCYIVKCNCYVVTITKNSQVILFCNKIGFSPFSKVSKGKKKGEPKQKILKEWVQPRMNRKCVDCGNDIAQLQIKCKRCEGCQGKYSKEWMAAYRSKYRAKNVEKVRAWQRKYEAKQKLARLNKVAK